MATFVEERGREIYEAIEQRRKNPADPIDPIFEKYGKENSLEPATVKETYYEHKKNLKAEAAAPPPHGTTASGPVRAIFYYEKIKALLDANPKMTQKAAIAQVASEIPGTTLTAVTAGFYTIRRQREGPGTSLVREGAVTKRPGHGQAKVKKSPAKAKAKKVETSVALVTKNVPKAAVQAPLKSLPVDSGMSLGSILRALADKVEEQDAEHAALKQLVRGFRSQLEDI